MLPNNSLSSSPVTTDFMCSSVPTTYNSKIDYELGAEFIGNTDSGLSYQIWTASINEYNNVILTPEIGDNYIFVQIPSNIDKLSLAFDQNMRPYIAYSVNNSSFLYWFDTSINNYTTTEFIDCNYPCITLDERRSDYISNSDVVLSYVRENKLCYRLQRDRYLIEYILDDEFYGKIITIGTNKNYRLQFLLRYTNYDIT